MEDKVYAHMWANLTSSIGFEMSVQLRQLLTELMTHSQIYKALLLAKEFKDRNLTGC